MVQAHDEDGLGDLLGMNEIPYDSNPQGNQGSSHHSSLQDPAEVESGRNDAYLEGYKAGKKKKLTQHIHEAVRKRVNIIHCQVLFFRAFVDAVK